MTSSVFDPAVDELAIATRKEIVFIENNVADIDTLIKGIGSGKEIVILDSTRDGLHQIAEALAGRSGIDALHIISHGAAGSLNLGAVTLDANGLEARHDELQAIGQSLRTGGDILLYGCSIAADGAAGQGNGFIEHLAIATGADIAASSNRTGSEDLGGDWNLEVSSGQVETAAVVDARTAALYHSVLATGLQNKTVTFSTATNFVNPQSTVYDGAGTDVVYKVDGLDAYRLVIDGAKDAVVAYDFGAATYVNVAGLPDASITENSVSISFTGGKLFTITSLEASRMNFAPGENLIFTGVDSNNQTHTKSVSLPGTSEVIPVYFSDFVDIKKITITTPDNGGVFKFFSLDNLVFSNIQAPPPAAPSAPDLAAASDTGSSNTDNYTNKTTGLVFTGTTDAGVTAVKLYEGSTEIASTSVISGTTYTVTTTGALSEGAHTITAKALDAGGNASSASSSLAVTVDTTAPSTTIASAALSQDSGTSNSDMITRFASQTISGTLSANLAAGERVMVSLDNGATWNPATASAGANTWQLASVTLAGSNTLKVKVEDLAGNGGTVYSHAYTLDQSQPTLTISSDYASLRAGETTTIRFTFSEDPGTSFSWDGSAGDIAVSGGTLSAITGSGATRDAIFTPNANVDNGTASISVTGTSYTDAAGNTGSNASLSINYDTLAPNNPSAPVLASADDKGDSSTDGITNKGTLLFSGTADPGATVKLYDTDGTTQVGSGSANAGGVWNITTSSLADGTHTIKAKAFDAAGNASASSTGTQVAVDTTPPTLSITSIPATPLKAGETATIRFSFSEDPGTSFSWDGSSGDIVVSGGTLSALTGSGATREAIFTPTANTDAGSATIKVLGGAFHDLAGNDNSVASNTLTVNYDTLAPSKPSAPSLAINDDTGASNSDYVTKANPLTVSGTADSGATVKLYDDATEIASTTASGGNYSFTLAGLAEGNHSFAVVAVDAAGNIGPVSDGLGITVDRTPPSTTVAGASLSADTGASSTDMVTREAQQTIAGTLSANLAAGERVMVSLDNGATWTPATASAGANTWELAGVTLAGSNTLKVKVEDLAGNGGTVYSHAYTLDTVAPAAPSVPDLDAASDSGSSSTDNITGVTLPSFSGTAEIGATVRLFDGGNEIGSVVAADGTWHITTGSAWAMGPRVHYITAEATDLAGNATSSAALEVTVRAAPATTVASMALSSDAGTDGDFITNAPSQTISGLLSANLAAGERVQVSLDGGASWSNATSAVGSNGWSIGAILTAGTHDIKARVTNDVDASGPVLTQAYTLDTVKPAVAITSDVSQLKAGDTANITFTFTEDPGTSFDGADISVSGGTLSALSGSGTTRTAVFTPDAATNAGTASIGIGAGKYEDLAGNTGLAGSSPSLSFDTLAPSAASAPDLDAASDKGTSSTDNLTNLTSLVFKGTAEAGATVRLYDSDGSTEIGSGTATGGNWTIATSTLGVGSHTVTAKVFDAAGNVSAASSATTVTIDTAQPSLSITSDASQLKIGETATITFTFSEDPGATFTWDGAAGDVTVSGGTLSAMSGTGTVRTATFAPSANTNGGTASISVSAGAYRDAAGNDGLAGATPSLHFDTLAPGAPSTPDLDAASDTGSSHTDNFTADTTPTFSGTAENGATVTLYDGATAIGSVVAAAGSWQITSDRALSAGAHTITAKAVDAAGNAGAASSGLAVQIITSGPATGIKDMALSLDSGTAGDFVTNTAAQTISGLLDAVLAAGERVQVSLDGGSAWNDAVSSTGSDAWSIAATLAAGVHDIRVRVIDAIDNTGPVHIQAYTLDSVKPAVIISSDVSQLKAGQTAAITFSFSEDPGASFDATDIVVSGGTLSALAGNGLVRTAVFTPSADTDGGTGSIAIKVDSYEDAAGNLGSAGASLSLSFDTLAPSAPSTPDLHKDSDSGPSDSDNLTHDTALVLTGTAENGATVRLYDSDGSTEIGHATAAGGVWTITTAALVEGTHAITAKAFDAAGNASAASGAISLTVDTSNPAALAAPVLASASDSGAPGDAITKATTPTFSGSAEALAQVTLYDGATAIGSVQADAQGAWQITAAALADGVHAISARQVDRAGNASGAGAVFSLTVDTVAPGAPAAPVLKASSDTGSIGDGVTENAIPVIEGTALANTLVTLYETAGAGKVKLGSALADGDGKWSVATTGLSIGSHVLSATQTDAAGNESAASAGFALRIAEPPVPIDTVDGMPVTIMPISLPGNVPGKAVSIPIVGTGRVESSGQPGVADIPIVTTVQGGPILLAQLPAGYGLSASGANLPAANAGELLIAAIKAATPGHAPADQGHLTGNGQSFLAGLGSFGSLLVETVKPVSSAAPEGVLTLSGPAPGAGQSTALVIDTGGLAAGATIALQQVNFAAVIGAADVTAGSGTILSGDAASQHFTVAAGGKGSVFAGGGNDVLSVAAPAAAGPAPAAGVTLLHGGAASDAATFSGARADYNIEFHNGYVMVSTRAAPDVKAMVVNVEQLQFSDASITVQNNADMNTLAGIYQTVLGRQADVMGIEYWANVHQAGASWGAIALNMIASSEHAASHEGFNGVAAHDLALLYAAIFDREADAGGMAYWTAALNHGVSLEQVASSFVESAEMVGHKRAATDWDFIVG